MSAAHLVCRTPAVSAFGFAKAVQGLSARRRAGVLGCKRTDCGPVEPVAVMGEEREEAVAQQAGNRHRHAKALGGGKHEPNILLPERRGEAGWLELSVGEERAVGLVDGRAE